MPFYEYKPSLMFHPQGTASEGLKHASEDKKPAQGGLGFQYLFGGLGCWRLFELRIADDLFETIQLMLSPDGGLDSETVLALEGVPGLRCRALDRKNLLRVIVHCYLRIFFILSLFVK